MLNIWPELPIVVHYNDGILGMEADNVIAALKLKGSVSRIDLTVNLHSAESKAKWEKIEAVMQDPFPMLKDFALRYFGTTPVTISDSFLGGSAPRRNLWLTNVVFPALPNLLLSATDLAQLWLWNIPHSGYISPEAMTTCISVLTRLESLSLRFGSPQSRSDRAGQFLPRLTRTSLPCLVYLNFKGVN